MFVPLRMRHISYLSVEVAVRSNKMRGHVGKRMGKRGVSWFYRVDMGRDATGKRTQPQKRGFRTRGEAERAMREMIRDLENGTYVPPSKMTLAQYLEEWKEDYVLHNVRASTAAEYHRIIDRNLVPQLGNHRIQGLKSQHIQRYVTKMLKSGRMRGEGGLSPTTVRNHFRVLSEALKHAVDMDIIKSNPADRVKQPKVEKFEPEVVTAEIAQEIMDEAEGTPWHVPLYLAFHSGVRRSEMAGLRWRDIHFEERGVAIDRARVVVKGGSVEGRTKSKSSRRLVSLSSEVIRTLTHHLEGQMEIFEALGVPWTEDCHLFCNDRGKPYHPSSFSKAFKRITRKAGFPDVRLHDTRHGHATILLGANVNMKVVQKRLGHSTITTTADTYSHVLREMDVGAAEVFEEQFNDDGSQKRSQN